MDNAASPRRALTKGQRTRERLLRAAIERFGTQGYRKTSVSQLSRDAGLTPAAAYAYFDDKDAFWRAAVNADLDALETETRDRALASARPVYELMAGLLAQLPSHALARRVLVDGSAADLRLVLEHRLFAGTTELIARALRARQVAGTLAPGLDPQMMATGIETVMFSMLLSIVRAGLEHDADRIEAVIGVLSVAVGGSPTEQERSLDFPVIG